MQLMEIFLAKDQNDLSVNEDERLAHCFYIKGRSTSPTPDIQQLA